MANFVYFQTADEAKAYIREQLGEFAENFDIDGIFKSTFIREAVMLRRVYSFQYDEFGFYCHLNPEEFWRQVELNRKR